MPSPKTRGPSKKKKQANKQANNNGKRQLESTHLTRAAFFAGSLLESILKSMLYFLDTGQLKNKTIGDVGIP